MADIENKKIGFIGQGFVGKAYADTFEKRGFPVVRYALEEPYVANKEKIKECDIVFVAVPTPTTPQGFDDSIVRKSVSLVRDGAIAVIKSTILPGTTQSIQKQYPHILVLHSPEFLTRATVVDDVAHPQHTIVGIPKNTSIYQDAARMVLSVLPHTDASVICRAEEAELFKYLRNCFFYTKVVFMNMLYTAAEKTDSSWETLKKLMEADPWIANKHLDPVHDSGRGAGGPCFVKDFAAFTRWYNKETQDTAGAATFAALEEKNKALLKESGKDMEVFDAVYGTAFAQKK